MGEYAPADRYERRKYKENIQLMHDVSVYSMPYGNNLDTVIVVWKIDPCSQTHESRNASVILSVAKNLPIFSTREM